MKAISQHLERPFDRFLLALIGIYQKRISPRKGWRCAYSKLHGGTGCSGFVREAIALHGHRAAIPMARERFRECKRASLALRAQRQDALDAPDTNEPLPPNPNGPRRNRGQAQGNDCLPDIACCDVCSVAPEAIGACEASSCHIGACDAGICECSGCFSCS